MLAIMIHNQEVLLKERSGKPVKRCNILLEYNYYSNASIVIGLYLTSHEECRPVYALTSHFRVTLCEHISYTTLPDMSALGDKAKGFHLLGVMFEAIRPLYCEGSRASIRFSAEIVKPENDISFFRIGVYLCHRLRVLEVTYDQSIWLFRCVLSTYYSELRQPLFELEDFSTNSIFALSVRLSTSLMDLKSPRDHARTTTYDCAPPLLDFR